MKFWYFRFEGKFAEDSPEYPNENVISSCLIPISDYTKGRSIFIDALASRNINLIEIVEFFAIDAEELDSEDELNDFWIEWYKETKALGTPVFEKMYLFPSDVSDK